ncbi:hypothetical protein EFW58_03719 [Bacillus velezensis]|nr:hypothetical protein EFW58_03719 [Bacillus velezensis]
MYMMTGSIFNLRFISQKKVLASLLLILIMRSLEILMRK